MPNSDELLTPEHQQQVESHRRLVAQVVAKLTRGKKVPVVPVKDLEQYGVLGLIAAVQTFDKNRGVPFGAYATRKIKEHIHTAVRKERGSRADCLRAARIAGDDYLAGVHAEGQITDPAEKVRARYIAVRGGYHAAEFAALVGAATRIVSDGPEEAVAVRRSTTRALAVLREAMTRLDKREREIVELRRFQGLAWEEICDRTGISMGSSIWRYHTGVMKRLADALRSHGLEGVPESR